MQFLTDLKKAAKGEREEEFSFDDDGEKGKTDKWLEKINNMSKKIQSAPAAAKEKLQKMREPKDEAKAAYFEEAKQEAAKSAAWWSGCDPQQDPDVKRDWSDSASSETVQSHANGDSVSSNDEDWPDQEESEEEDADSVPIRMSQVDFNALKDGGTIAPKAPPPPTIKEEPEEEKKGAPAPKATPEAAQAPPVEEAPKVTKPPAATAPAADPFGSSGDEAPPAASSKAPAPAKASAEPKAAADPFGSSGEDAPKPVPKKASKKPAKARPAPAKPAAAADPFADSDGEAPGATATAGYPAASPPAAKDPFADSDDEAGPLLPSPPGEAGGRRASQVPALNKAGSLSSSGPEGAKKAKKPKARPVKSAEDGATASTSSGKKPARAKPKKAPLKAAQDSDGEDARF